MLRRLDVKIVLTLLFTAMVPLGISIYLVSKAVDISLGVGLNDEIAEHIKKRLEIHRRYIEEIKEGHRKLMDHLADSFVLKEATLSNDKAAVEKILLEYLQANNAILSIKITGSDTETVKVAATAKPKIHSIRKLVKTKKISMDPYGMLEVIFCVDQAISENYARAGRDMNTYMALVSAPPYYLSRRVILVYLALLGGVFFISITFGMFWAKRLARRIHALSEATAAVTSGDLSVRVDPGSQDEVGILVDSFNKMVTELSDSRARIEYLQKISAWQEIARRLAHEIKNPLTPIHLAAQQLREKWNGDDPVFGRLLEQSTEIIEEEVATLRRLTADFSSFARLPQIKPKSISLHDFIRECEASLSYLELTEGLSLYWELPDEQITVMLDRTMMKRVIDNLVRNAAEALQNTDTEKPEIKISVTTGGGEKSMVEIQIEDNGPGIMPDHHPSIFEPYFTTKSEGTGLGLAISKKIVLEHGGRIWMNESSLGGAVFTIAIPG